MSRDNSKPKNPSASFQDVLQRRLSRRTLLEDISVFSAAIALPATTLLAGCTTTSTSNTSAVTKGNSPASTLSFEEIPHALDEHFTVPPGYQSKVLIRWGDPLFNDSIAFDPLNQSQESQLSQFGYNNDFVGFVPLPIGSDNSNHGLLAVNHEFVVPRTMQPGSPTNDQLTIAQVDIDIAAHGLSVIEIKKEDNEWNVIVGSSYNRRITPNTEMVMTGPAAGSKRLITELSPDGKKTFGTYYNCSGGVTPWGTVLTAEENINLFFNGDATVTEEAENHARMGMGTALSGWHHHYSRWDINESPREPLHMGWIVEIDPSDPNSIPRKRTALGRCKHEGCNVFVNADNTVVAYTGDDQQFEYIYKFISNGHYNAEDRAANMTLLDEGTLYAARFDEDGSLHWLPLVFGQGPLVAENGFLSQADVLIDTRKSADLLGATPMDRPEDVEVNPTTGRVFVTLTNNTLRPAERIDKANPRANNKDGQIVEFWPESGHHGDANFKWQMFVLAGDPATGVPTQYHPDTSENGWLSCPDNIAFDNLGNLWIASDGAQIHGIADGVWATAVEGPERALTKRFIRSPIGSELTGPFFTPDSENFFCSVQHPGQGPSYEEPLARWPDFDDKLPPRPSVMVVTKTGGGRIGS